MIAGQIKDTNFGTTMTISPDDLARQVANLVLDGIGARRDALAPKP